jgi:hypothetical protein
MDLAALSVASLSALFTAVAATAAWQAARVGSRPARLIALQLKDGDSSSAFALSLTSVRSSDGRRYVTFTDTPVVVGSSRSGLHAE